MLSFSLGVELSPQAIARSHVLPTKPASVELAGASVRLTPTNPACDAGALFAVSNGDAIQIGERTIAAYDPDPLVWRYMPYGPFADLEAFAAYLENLCNLPDLRAMTVYTQTGDQPIGVMTFMANEPAHLKIELGHIWISPVMQGSGIMIEAAYLMLRHCFALGYRRVEWKCDSLNERSRRAALKLGFTFEGIQEYHRIVKGRSRDSAWFRILDHEWPARQARLEAIVQPPDGQKSHVL